MPGQGRCKSVIHLKMEIFIYGHWIKKGTGGCESHWEENLKSKEGDGVYAKIM